MQKKWIEQDAVRGQSSPILPLSDPNLRPSPSLPPPQSSTEPRSPVPGLDPDKVAAQYDASKDAPEFVEQEPKRFPGSPAATACHGQRPLRGVQPGSSQGHRSPPRSPELEAELHRREKELERGWVATGGSTKRTSTGTPQTPGLTLTVNLTLT